MILSPSILSADFGYMHEELENIKKAGAEYVHVDVMDGHFVPNISLGIPVVKSLRKHSDLFFDVHLMIENPMEYIEAFLDSGADLISFHYEAVHSEEIKVITDFIHKEGKKAGLVIKPKTKVEEIKEYLPFVDLLLIMTVEPGFGGQEMMDTCLEKIKVARKIREDENLEFLIEIDGGVKKDNLDKVYAYKPDLVVAGSAVFERGRTFENTKEIIKIMEELHG